MNNQEMKIFAFQPTGYGQHSFFVVATSEAEASEADLKTTIIITGILLVLSVQNIWNYKMVNTKFFGL